jgi:hypothetical protein
MLSEEKYLSFLPPGYSAGEDGQYRIVNAKTIKFNVAVPGYEWLNDEQFEQLVNVTTRARDRFLVCLLGATGIRIGEALGLHRQDMHLLSTSASLGCQVLGPHIHVRRRQNANGALAKYIARGVAANPPGRGSVPQHVRASREACPGRQAVEQVLGVGVAHRLAERSPEAPPGGAGMNSGLASVTPIPSAMSRRPPWIRTFTPLRRRPA